MSYPVTIEGKIYTIDDVRHMCNVVDSNNSREYGFISELAEREQWSGKKWTKELLKLVPDDYIAPSHRVAQPPGLGLTRILPHLQRVGGELHINSDCILMLHGYKVFIIDDNNVHLEDDEGYYPIEPLTQDNIDHIRIFKEVK